MFCNASKSRRDQRVVRRRRRSACENQPSICTMSWCRCLGGLWRGSSWERGPCPMIRRGSSSSRSIPGLCSRVSGKRKTSSSYKSTAGSGSVWRHKSRSWESRRGGWGSAVCGTHRSWMWSSGGESCVVERGLRGSPRACRGPTLSPS